VYLHPDFLILLAVLDPPVATAASILHISTCYCLRHRPASKPDRNKSCQGGTVVQTESSTTSTQPLLAYLKSAMPSYLRHSRNARAYSFPPCIDSFEDSSQSENELPDIDEEPFAHFLTPLTEEDDPYGPLSLSAGIFVPDGPRTSKASKFKSNVADKWARYVRGNHAQLHTRYHVPQLQTLEEDDESFMQLEDDRLNDTPHMVTHIATPRITIVEPTRGRAQDLLTRRSRRRYSRTLSGHRHSWREPSPDLFTVDESESEEDDIPVLRRTKTKKSKDSLGGRRSSRSRVRSEVAEKSRL
jgi:hypothetical protein